MIFGNNEEIPTYEKWFGENKINFNLISLLTYSKLSNNFKQRILGGFTHHQTTEYAISKFSDISVVGGVATLENGSKFKHSWCCNKNQMVLDFYSSANKIKVISYEGIKIPSNIYNNYIYLGGWDFLQINITKFYYFKTYNLPYANQ